MHASQGKFTAVVIALTLCCTSLPCLSALIAGSYAVTNLGVLGSGPDSGAWGINNYGQVTGWSGVESTGNYRPFLWTPNERNGSTGSMVGLGVPATPSITNTATGWGLAWSINDYGQVSGYCGQSPNATTDGFLWTPSSANSVTGNIQRIDVPTGQTNGAGLKINNYGEIACEGGPAWVWVPLQSNGTTGTATRLSTTINFAEAVNDAGDVGGNHFFFRPSSAHGTTGTIVSVNGWIWALNDSGLAVGDGGSGPAVWQVSNGAAPTLTLLASFPASGTGRRRATGVNEAGIAVGDTYAGTLQIGFAWSVQDGLIDLNTRLDPMTAAGCTILGAREINDAGQIVVKMLVDPDNDPMTNNSQIRAGLLTPIPEPRLPWLFLMPFLAFFSLRRPPQLTLADSMRRLGLL